MSVALRRPITISAPAKLNLGLEVLGRRDDGYHDLATVFLTVSLFDVLTLSNSGRLEASCEDRQLSAEDNLVLRAATSLREGRALQHGAIIELRKAIPVAAGLGGASSDAAATLVGLRALWQLTASDDDLALLAKQIGSDVPFFLRGGCALGQGRGEILERLPVPNDVWFVVIAPRISIPRKTASLYAALREGDLGEGAKVAAQAARLRANLDIDTALLGNAFSRPLYERMPTLSELPRTIRRAGAQAVALSGAGPAHYAVVSDPQLAQHIANRLQSVLGNRADVVAVSPIPERSILPGDYDVT